MLCYAMLCYAMLCYDIGSARDSDTFYPRWPVARQMLSMGKDPLGNTI